MINLTGKIYWNSLKALRFIGVNKAVFYGLATRVWVAITGIIFIYLITSYFTPQVQGYYYTFRSLLGLQIFVELGLGVVIINFASHEWSKLGLDEKGRITGDPNALSRLKGLTRISFKWYFVGSVILCLVLGMSGYIFMARPEKTIVDWVIPWIFLCVISCINLCITPALCVIEGCNQITEIFYCKFIGEIVRFISTAIVIMLNGGLWAAAASMFFPLLWMVIYLLKKYYFFFRTLIINDIVGPKIDWWKEIWPMQWRIAVSWISGFFIFSLFVPTLFYFHGAIVAGQMGLSCSITSTLTALANTWIASRAPVFGVLASKREFIKLDKLFFKISIISVLIAFLGAIAIYCIVLFLNVYYVNYASRLLPPPTMLVLLIATVLMQISYPQSTYLRAHKEEPLMGLSVSMAVIMAILSLIFGRLYGAMGLSASYLFAVVFVTIPFETIIWYRRRREWYPEYFSKLSTISEGGAFNEEEYTIRDYT